MKMIWATRGRSWGFRFLRDGGFPDPLLEYEKAFEGHSSESQLWMPRSDYVVLRFPDPLGRQDLAGRDISHDFVIYESEIVFRQSFETAKEAVWDEVSSEYLELWDQRP